MLKPDQGLIPDHNSLQKLSQQVVRVLIKIKVKFIPYLLNCHHGVWNASSSFTANKKIVLLTIYLSAQKSNSNIVGCNFQTDINISITINTVFKVTLKFSGENILHGCHLLKTFVLYTVFPVTVWWILVIQYNILKLLS